MKFQIPTHFISNEVILSFFYKKTKWFMLSSINLSELNHNLMATNALRIWMIPLQVAAQHNLGKRLFVVS